MDAPARREEFDFEDELEESTVIVTSHETRPGKVVFTERNNTDGWIATDFAIDLEP